MLAAISNDNNFSSVMKIEKVNVFEISGLILSIIGVGILFHYEYQKNNCFKF